jgi:hypothetical protein
MRVSVQGTVSVEVFDRRPLLLHDRSRAAAAGADTAEAARAAAGGRAGGRARARAGERRRAALDLLPEEPLPLDEPLPEPEPDPDPEPEPLPEPEPEPEPLPEPDPLCAVAGMSLWTQTPSASSVFVPGMWMATVRVGASILTTDSTSSSFMCSSIRKSPAWMNSADAKPHSSPRRIMNGCSGVAFRRRLMTMNPWCSPRVMLATRAATDFALCRPWCESQLYWAR